MNLKTLVLFGYREYLNAYARTCKLIDLVNNKREMPYYCPCCGTRLYRWRRARYAKHIDLYDPARYKSITYNTMCPVCNSLQRHRILTVYLKSGKIDLKNSRILYFAVEKCVADWLHRSGVSITSADLYKKADLNIDIEDTGLPDKSYDLIICNHVLEHVNTYQKALKELHRILSDKGILICSFPMDLSLDTVLEDESITTAEDRIKHFGQADHLRIFGSDSRDILKTAGFDVTTVDEEITVSDKILPLPGPADYDQPIVYVCRKSAG